MKALSFIFLLFIAQNPALKVGDYKAAKPFPKKYDDEQSLTLKPDGTFLRIYYASEMHFEKRQHRITGAWSQNADTLTLTDTLFIPSYVSKTSTKRIYGVEDTVVISTIKYNILKDGKLHFISSIVGTKEWFKMPDFVYQPNSQ